jgi:ABC-type transport system involved in cytochrome bd biosynthesis fused ATPase/permease subunit
MLSFLEKQTLAQVMRPLLFILLAISGRSFLSWLNEVAANAVAVKIKTDLRNVSSRTSSNSVPPTPVDNAPAN